MSEEENNISPLGVSLELSVFVCGALVMIYEIIGSRIIAPFLGTSTYIWTSLIGVILGALSLGYWIGGRAADRRPNVRVLASAIFAAGGLVSLTILLKDVILQIVSDAPVSIELRSLIAALLVFAPASVALGFVIPYASKLRILSLDQAGSTVGRLYALSTIGSIAGTFLAGFVLIPFVGSVRTLYLIAGTLFAVSFLLAGMSFSRPSVSVLLLFVLGVVSSEGGAYYLARTNGLYDMDTEYSRIRIFNAIYPPNGREIKALATDPATLQSARYLDSDELVLAYTRFYHLAKFHTPEMRKVLMIGGAGYSFPKEFLHEYPAAKMDVVEIDPGMTAIAREHFGLKDDPRLRIFHQDGRVFLNNAPPASYDVVMMDAFGSLFTVPFQLTTVEAVRRIYDVLDEDGAVVFNIGSSLTGDSSLFLQAELATYRSVFPVVNVYKVDKSAPDERLQNIIIVASKLADTVPQADENAKHAFLLSHLRETPVNDDMPILTDDLAPVERYLSIAQALK
ncbi:MAG: fused MFS/spermidine synthase [Acidobacteria bacterium]|nr:fused MFS/spermidine synthase [Acidobacteriota bacterium]